MDRLNLFEMLSCPGAAYSLPTSHVVISSVRLAISSQRGFGRKGSSLLIAMQNKISHRTKPLMIRFSQTSSETKKHLAAASVILAITIILFAPVMRGRTFSMVAAHMFVQYPWNSIIKDTPEVGGRGFPQTDHAEFFYPTSVFATNAIQSGQLPMWLPYNFG